ncbi:hypothetical protein JD793_002768 [Citrobacter braakii]|nr:hypothetical protein [Citrobacter braakii]
MYSSAHNSIMHLSGNPDPQTGLYSFSYPVAELLSCYGFGPQVSLSLSFSMMSSLSASTVDAQNNPYQMGRGWALNVARYDKASGAITLNNGTSYVQLGKENNEWTLNYALRDIRITEDSEFIYVYHKDGTSETLAFTDDSKDAAYLTSLRSAQGLSVYFEYTFKNGVNQLRRIYDDNATLLSVSYSDGMTTFTVNPDTPEEAVSVLYYGESVTIIVQPDGSEITFSYQTFEQRGLKGYLISAVDYPDGTQESVFYDNHLNLPSGAPIDYLPALSSHTRMTSDISPDIVTEFKFGDGLESDFNYWGNNSGANWNDRYDSLAEYDGTYEYRCSTQCGDKSTDYSFNKFHQLLSQSETIDNAHIKLTTFEYFGDDSLPQSQQTDVRYQLMKSSTLNMITPDGDAAPLTRTFDYDAWGNLLEQVGFDGLIHQLSYYPKEGVDGDCPAHPTGFCAFIQTQTTMSAGRSLQKQYGMRYGLLTPSDSQSDLVVLTEMTYGKDSAEFEYFSVEDNSCLQGSIQRINNTVDGITTVTERTVVFSDNTLTKTTTLRTREGLARAGSETLSLWTGRSLAITDADDVSSTCDYDILGRPLCLTRAKDSEYETATTLSYQYLPDVAGIPEGDSGTGMRIILTSPASIQYVDMDAEQKILCTCVQDENDTWRKSADNRYDAQGRLASSSRYEYVFDNESASVVSTCSQSRTNTYGAWGEITRTDYSNGTARVRSISPLDMTVREYTECPATKNTLSTSVVQYNLFGKPECLKVVQENGDVYSETQFEYDGLGRYLSVTTPAGYTKSVTEYDIFDRPLTLQDFDGSQHVMTYQPGTAQPWLTAISIQSVNSDTPTIMGQCSFDGLGRILDKTTGTVTRRWQYEGTRLVPASMTNGRGQSTTMAFIPELRRFSAIDDAEFTYATTSTPDTPAGMLLSAQNKTGQYDYNRNSRGRVTSVTQSTDTGAERQTGSLRYLLSGAMLACRIQDRIVQLTLDDQGRPDTSDDRDIDTVLYRDEFGRVNKTETSLFAEIKSTTVMTYDALSREITRTITFTDNPKVTFIRNEYDVESRLTLKETLVDGVRMIQENYAYDEKSRLIAYVIDADYQGDFLPENEWGKKYTEQRFSHDALNNLTEMQTVFANGDNDTATYHYDGLVLLSISHSLTEGENAYPAQISFRYDADGNVVSVYDGTTSSDMTYSAFNRMLSYNDTPYRYDAFQRLCSAGDNQRYYLGNRVVEDTTTGEHCEYVHSVQHPVAERQGDTLLLLGADAKLSIVTTCKDGNVAHTQYGPYGQGRSVSVTGYNGELKDAASQGYALGNGTRFYHPAMARFNSQDSASPFGAGGLNPYAYCNGNPVNLSDPSGHSSQGFVGGLLSIIGGVIGLLFAIPTGGASLSIGVAIGAGLDVAGIVASTVNMSKAATSSSYSSSISMYSQQLSSGDDSGSGAGLAVGISLGILALLGLTSLVFMGGAAGVGTASKMVKKRGLRGERSEINSLGLLERQNFGDFVFRLDNTPREFVQNNGFFPSSDFGAIPKMMEGDALIVAENLKGIENYHKIGRGQGTIYRINAMGVKGVSLNENIEKNFIEFQKHINLESGDCLRDIINGADEMQEAHIDFEQLKQEKWRIQWMGELNMLSEMPDLFKI